MKAQVGEWLVIEGGTAEDHRRTGRIVEVKSVDGTPPYLVRWLDDGHETLVFPGPNAHVEPHLTHEVRYQH